MLTRSPLQLIIFALLILLGVSACEQSSEVPTQKVSPPIPSSSELQSNDALLDTISKSSSKTFNNLALECGTLIKHLKAFREKIDLSNHKAAIEAWHTCHDHYQATTLFRELLAQLQIKHPELEPLKGPSTNMEEPSHDIHTKIDQYPHIPGYLDSVPGYPYSGIIHSDTELTLEQLNYEHQLGDRAYVAIGLHAIETILFGQTENTSERIEDFNSKATEPNQSRAASRRLRYLELLEEQLERDILALTRAWTPNTGYYLIEIKSAPDLELKNALEAVISREKNTLNNIANKTGHGSSTSIQYRQAILEDVVQHDQRKPTTELNSDSLTSEAT